MCGWVTAVERRRCKGFSGTATSPFEDETSERQTRAPLHSFQMVSGYWWMQVSDRE